MDQAPFCVACNISTLKRYACKTPNDQQRVENKLDPDPESCSGVGWQRNARLSFITKQRSSMALSITRLGQNAGVPSLLVPCAEGGQGPPAPCAIPPATTRENLTTEEHPASLHPKGTDRWNSRQTGLPILSMQYATMLAIAWVQPMEIRRYMQLRRKWSLKRARAGRQFSMTCNAQLN